MANVVKEFTDEGKRAKVLEGGGWRDLEDVGRD